MQAAFFDLDKTVIAKASVAAFGPTLYNQGLISKRILIRAAVAQLVFIQLGASHNRLEGFRKSLLTITRGWEKERVERIVTEALTEVLEPIIYREALDLIEQHQAEGRKVVIISSSPEEIVKPLAEFLGADDAIGSRALVDSEGKYTGELEFYAYGDQKAELVRQMAAEQDIDLSESYAYSDSHTDVPMLDAVGHPVAVNPDKELMREARAHKWPIVTFSHPMPMRDASLRTRMRIATALLGVGAVGGMGVAAGFWKLSRSRRDFRNNIERYLSRK